MTLPARPLGRTLAAAAGLATIGAACAGADPRIRTLTYDPDAVIHVLTERGAVTHIELPPAEAIREVASGQGADCAKPELPWCIVAEPGQNHVFVKPRQGARTDTLSIVTDRRSYTLELEPLREDARRAPMLRLVVRAADPAPAADSAPSPSGPARARSRSDRLAGRLRAAPDLVNADYSVAVGRDSDEIVPTLVFDDGRFTYLGFPGNRELPAVFQVQEDRSESMVNTRMEDDRLVVDRVARKLLLRKGGAVVAVINEHFDLEGRPPRHGTTVPGVERTLLEGVDPIAAPGSQP